MFRRPNAPRNVRVRPGLPKLLVTVLTVTLMLLTSLAVAIPTASAQPTCQSAESDSDGDGWGWENGASCVVGDSQEPSNPICSSAASDPDGDGWGWENGASCVVEAAPEPEPQPPTPSHSFCPPDASGDDWDTDGDGWGWLNGQSCKVQAPRAVDADLLDRVFRRIKSPSSSTELSADQKAEVADAIVRAFGHRTQLIDRWINESAAYVSWVPSLSDAGLSGRYRGPTLFRRGRMSLATTNEFTVVHEFIHALDCSGNGSIDGLPKYMSSADRNILASERNRLVQIYNATDRTVPPAGLRGYTFENREEFIADVSTYFLTSRYTRWRLADEAPALYDVLRDYYGKTMWPTAEDFEADWF